MLVRESKRKLDEEFGRKLSVKFSENRKLFWKEMKRVRGGKEAISTRMRGEDGQVMTGVEEELDGWRNYFENLMSESGGGRAIVTCMGMDGGGRRSVAPDGISREEIKNAIARLKSEKSPGCDGVTAEMLKGGDELVVDWMHAICVCAWEEECVPDEWSKAVMTPLYKGKGKRDEYKNHRGISLLSIPGKVYGRVVIEKVMKVTEHKICEEQAGFRKGRGCVDQIFILRLVVEKFLAKNKKLYVAFMDLEKAYDKVEWEALWEVLKIYGVGGKLLKAVQAFYRNSRACVRVNGKVSEEFDIHVGVRQGCVMSPWLFNIYMDGVMREMKARVGRGGVKLEKQGEIWYLMDALFADDTVLLAESEGDLQKMVKEFEFVCSRRKLKVNVGKSKVMVFERQVRDTIDFRNPYRVVREEPLHTRVEMRGVVMEEVSEFKYLGSVFSKHGSVEAEVRDRAMQGRKVIGALGSVMKGRTVSVDAKRGIRDSVLLPTLTYGSETWNWNAADESRIRAVEMSYLRGASGVRGTRELSNEEVYERFGMGERAVGVGCGVVESVKRSTLRWFGHVERMESDRLTKRVYQSSVPGINARGRPPVSWEGRVSEYVRERMYDGVRGLEHAREMCKDRSGWRSFCRGHPLKEEFSVRTRRQRYR